MELIIRTIRTAELDQFASILLEGALWLLNEGKEMWSADQISTESLLSHNSFNDMYMGFVNKEAAAVMILQEEDAMMWPDDRPNESLYLHKLCIYRKFAKSGVSADMIEWAKLHAENLHKRYLKLDCAADRPRLCEYYMKQGFQKVKEELVLGKYPTSFYKYELA
jgi:GNAT superfamily N-acetyltransferase